MDLALKPEHKAFADEIRDFARKNLSPATREKTFSGKHYDRDDHLIWQQALGRQGWLAYTWPKKYGGPGWDVTQRFLFENVLAEEGAPRIIPFGVKMVGPVIYTFGSDEQKERFLPGIRQSTVSWCQGYSEPGAGSDLANLRTRAMREGDHYIVNGQKTWTSFAHWGDWIFCLVRTNPDAKPQLGIAEVPASKRGVRSLRDIARSEPADGATLAHDPAFTAQIADLDLQVQALEMSELRALSAMAQGGAPGPEVSTLKIRGSEIQQRIAELAMEAVGEYAQPYQPGMLFHDTNETPVGPDHAPPAAPRYFNMRKTSIYGGSNEIQKNIVSKMVLGL